RVAADADNDMVSDHNRRRRAEVLLPDVGDLLVPAFLAGCRVERYQVAVRRLEENRVIAQADAPVADMDAAPGPPEVMPDLPARASINGVRMIGHCQIEDAVYHQRGRLDGDRRGRPTPVVGISGTVLSTGVPDLLP